MNLLALSDVEVSFIYSPVAAKRFRDIDMVIGCGDLSYIYIEHLIDVLGVPAYFVRGNHASPVEYKMGVERSAPWGAVDLHLKNIKDPSGLLLAGIEGSIRYNLNAYQYSQVDMWLMVYRLVPKLLMNKLRCGRYLDIFVTHASPWGIHDGSDFAHQGIKAFRWLIKVFQPLLHLHGHVHIYNPLTRIATKYHRTKIMNVYGFQEQEIILEGKNGKPVLPD